MLEFLDAAVNFWIGGAFLTLFIDWIQGWPRILGDQKSVQRSLKQKRKAGRPEELARLSFIYETGKVLLMMGPFGLLMPSIKHD